MTISSTLRSIFGKTLAIGFLLTALSAASFAQSQYAAFYNKSSNGHEGYIGVYGSEFRINWSSPGLVTVVAQPCTVHSDKTFTCTATTYRNGQLDHKGEYQSFTSGVDFGMRYTQKWVVNHWESEYNDGWSFYYAK
mgnify:CR=1 FL=1